MLLAVTGCSELAKSYSNPCCSLASPLQDPLQTTPPSARGREPNNSLWLHGEQGGNTHSQHRQVWSGREGRGGWECSWCCQWQAVHKIRVILICPYIGLWVCGCVHQACGGRRVIEVMSRDVLLSAETMRHDKHVPVLVLLKLFTCARIPSLAMLACNLLYLTLLHLPKLVIRRDLSSSV